MVKYIFLLGLPGSGKGTVSKLISKKYNGAHFAFGDIIRGEIRKRKKKYTRNVDEEVVKWFHTGGRQKLLALRMWRKIKNSREKLIIIEGCRNVLQYKTFCKLVKQKPILIYVFCKKNIREHRMLKRARFKTEDVKGFRAREARELKQGLCTLLKWSKYRIDNSNSLAKTMKNTKKVMKKILHKA